jgi:4-amino-4-deoxy-L-arabinose transferase-like glycosyltransferase
VPCLLLESVLGNAVVDSTPILEQTVSFKPRGVLEIPLRRALGLVLGLAALVFAIRFFAPAEWADGYHEERAIAYATDVLFNGHWICQTGAYGEITSKPPLLTWLLASSVLVTGGPSTFALVFPSAVATTLIALLIFWAGNKFFGLRAGLFAALIYLLSPLSAKQMVLVRIDVLFSLTITATALCAYRSWAEGRSWTWFWGAAALATLAKGPLGLLLGGIGLLAVFWEKRSGKPARLRGSHLFGVTIFLVLCGGWFLAAYLQMGKGLVDVMLGKELLGHVVQEKDGGPFSQGYLPILYVCRCFVPWVILSLVGWWRVIRHPAGSDEERRFERFVFAWFTGGLLIFSGAAHQRPDLIFPLVPPAALLAGREFARLVGNRSLKQLAPALAGIAVVGLTAIVYKYGYANRNKEDVLRTRGMRELASQIQQLGRGEFPLTHVDSSVALQFFLRTKRPWTSIDEAARLLISPSATFVVVKNLTALQNQLGTNGPALYKVASWQGRKDKLFIVSNHPKLEWTDQMGFVMPPVQVKLRSIDSVHIRDWDFEFASSKGRGEVLISAVGTNKLPRLERIRESSPLASSEASDDTIRFSVTNTTRFALAIDRSAMARLEKPKRNAADIEAIDRE